MKRLIAALLFCVSTVAMAIPEFEVFKKELEYSGPVEEIEVNAASPSYFMTGYSPETKRCALLINQRAIIPEGVLLIVSLAHEAGHCYALRMGLQDISKTPTKYGEAFGDVFALAWIAKNRPDIFQQAVGELLEQRKRDRRQNSVYDTLFIIRVAQSQLPTLKDPIDFTVEVLK